MINGIGDIFVLVGLASEVIAKLNATRHAPEEITQLIGDVEDFKSCVAHADNSIQRHGTMLRPNDELKIHIVSVLQRCEKTTMNLEKIVTTYEIVVTEEAVASNNEQSRRQWNRTLERLNRLYRSVRWTTIQEAVLDLRSQFQRHIQILQFVTQQISNRQIDFLLEMFRVVASQPGPLTLIPSSPALSLLPSSTSPTSPILRDWARPRSFRSPTTSDTPSMSNRRLEAPAMEQLELPSALIDLENYNFLHDLDLELPESFPNVTPGDQYRNVKRATRREQEDFIEQLRRDADIIEIPVISVDFVYKASHTTQRAVIEASDRGKVLLLSRHGDIEDIWTMNNERTIRFVQKLLPRWVVKAIPYSANGENCNAVVEQGPGLTFVTLEDGKQVPYSIPTTWVTYRFENEDDCKRFQEHLYGWDLELTVPVREIYRPRHIMDDEHLVGVQNIRVWKSRSSSEMKFMVRLSPRRGRKKYLEFDLCQETIRLRPSESRHQFKLAFLGINATIDEPSSERRESSSSLSSVSSARSMSPFISHRFSRDHSPPLDHIVIVFGQRNDRDQLESLVVNCRSGRSIEA